MAFRNRLIRKLLITPGMQTPALVTRPQTFVIPARILPRVEACRFLGAFAEPTDDDQAMSAAAEKFREIIQKLHKSPNKFDLESKLKFELAETTKNSKDGYIAADDFRRMLKNIGDMSEEVGRLVSAVDDSEVEYMLKCADANRDGKISIKEFVNFVYMRQR